MKRMIILMLLVIMAVGCASDPVSTKPEPSDDPVSTGNLTCTYTFRTNVVDESDRPSLTIPVYYIFGGDIVEGWSVGGYIARFYPYGEVTENKVRGLLTEADIAQYEGVRNERTDADKAVISTFLSLDSLSQIAMIEGYYAKYREIVESSEELSKMLGGYETDAERDRTVLVRIFTEKESELVGMKLVDISECSESDYVTAIP